MSLPVKRKEIQEAFHLAIKHCLGNRAQLAHKM